MRKGWETSRVAGIVPVSVQLEAYGGITGVQREEQLRWRMVGCPKQRKAQRIRRVCLAVMFAAGYGGRCCRGHKMIWGWGTVAGAWLGVVANTSQEAQRTTTRVTVVLSDAGVRATEYVKIALKTGMKVVGLPKGCEVPRGRGEGASTR